MVIDVKRTYLRVYGSLFLEPFVKKERIMEFIIKRGKLEKKPTRECGTIKNEFI